MKRLTFPRALLLGLFVSLVLVSAPATSRAQGGFSMGGGGFGGFPGGGGPWCGFGGFGGFSGSGFGCGGGFMPQSYQPGWSQQWPYPVYTYQAPGMSGYVQPQAGVVDPYNTASVTPSVPYSDGAFQQTSVATGFVQPQINMATNSGTIAVAGDGRAPIVAASGEASPSTGGGSNGGNVAISQRLVLQNAKSTNGPVHYMIDGAPHTLAAGSIEELSISASCVVEFDRGTGGATARYTLASGFYRFGISDHGWELYRETCEVTLDNRANDAAFHYLRDGRQESVPAGGTRILSEKFPIKVSFDRGTGGEPAERSLDQNGCTYRIAFLNASDGLDLIATSAH